MGTPCGSGYATARAGGSSRARVKLKSHPLRDSSPVGGAHGSDFLRAAVQEGKPYAEPDENRAGGPPQQGRSPEPPPEPGASAAGGECDPDVDQRARDVEG